MSIRHILFRHTAAALILGGAFLLPAAATAETEAPGNADVAMIDRSDTIIDNSNSRTGDESGGVKNGDADTDSDVDSDENKSHNAKGDNDNSDDDDADIDEDKPQTKNARVPPHAQKPAGAHKKNDAQNNAPDNDKNDTANSEETAKESDTENKNWWQPHPGTKWQIQYAGTIDTSHDVAAYDLDLIDTDMSLIRSLHERGIKVICYFSAGSYEKWRADANRFPASVLGRSNGWRDEKWLDIRKINILKPIMSARVDLAKAKGCDAVDPDNVEGYDNKSGFPLTYKDQLAYNKMIADLAHKAGMAVGLKNDLDQVKDLIRYFDFAVNEQCFEYQTCDDLIPFIKADKPVFNIEYKGDTSKFCSEANAMNFDSLKKDLDLDAKVSFCR